MRLVAASLGLRLFPFVHVAIVEEEAVGGRNHPVQRAVDRIFIDVVLEGFSPTFYNVHAEPRTRHVADG